MSKKQKKRGVALSKAEVDAIEKAEKAVEAEDRDFQRELDRCAIMLDRYIHGVEKKIDNKLNECVPDRRRVGFPYLKPFLVEANGVDHHRGWLDYSGSIHDYIQHCTNMASGRGRLYDNYGHHVLPKLDNEVSDLVKIYENLHRLFELAFNPNQRPGDRVEHIVRAVKHGVPSQHGGKPKPLFLDSKYAETASAKRLIKDIFEIFSENERSSHLLAAQGLYAKPIIRERMDRTIKRKGSLRR